MILLYSDHIHGVVPFPAGEVEGYAAPARIYHLVDHWMVVDGGTGTGAETIAKHDAEELLRHGHYRLATAAEQQAYAAQQRKATTIEEGSPKGSKKNGG